MLHTSECAHQHDFQRVVQPLEHLAQLDYHRQLGFHNHVVIIRHGLLRQNQLFYLALANIDKKWTMLLRDWKVALTRFTIQFEERMLKT
jgi:transposase-like protein